MALVKKIFGIFSINTEDKCTVKIEDFFFLKVLTNSLTNFLLKGVNKFVKKKLLRKGLTNSLKNGKPLRYTE